MKQKSAIYCNHANEMPNICPCDDDCYCKKHSCDKRRTIREDRSLGKCFCGHAWRIHSTKGCNVPTCDCRRTGINQSTITVELLKVNGWQYSKRLNKWHILIKQNDLEIDLLNYEISINDLDSMRVVLCTITNWSDLCELIRILKGN